MKSVIYLLFVLVLVGAAKTKQPARNLAAKADELRELQLASKDGLINLNATGYFYYTMEFPRPYDMVIYFTAPNCKLCEELQTEYKQVAQFYRDSGAMQAIRDEGNAKRAVFFAIVAYNDNNKQVFNQLGFNSVPNLFVSQPKIVVVPQDERNIYLREFRWMITNTDGHVTSHKLLEYINKRTGRNVEYKPQFLEVMMMIGILFGTVALAVIMFRGFKTIFNNPRLWFAGSILIYGVCMAGLVHNIIHNVPFTSQDAQGNVEWKTSGGRQQLGAEGFVMSVCITSVGITMVLYHKILKAPAIANDVMVLRLAYLSLFGVTYVLIKFIEEVYKEKSWYDPRFWPPATYIKGPLMRDQGNSI